MQKKVLIKIQNIDDNECFNWCLIRCLYPVDHNPRNIRKVDKLLRDELDFEDIRFLVKIKDI